MKNLLTRRQALKTIVAATGAVAASSFVPEKWVKPLVKTGVVPAHAQASVDLFQVEAIALDTDFLPWSSPFVLGPSHPYIGIKLRLNAVKSKVAVGGYCVTLNMSETIPNNVFWDGSGLLLNPPWTLTTDWLDVGHLTCERGSLENTWNLIFNLYNCPAGTGPILQSITVAFTFSEAIDFNN